MSNSRPSSSYSAPPPPAHSLRSYTPSGRALPLVPLPPVPLPPVLDITPDLTLVKSTSNPYLSCSVTTMSNSGPYPVTPVASQHYSSIPVAHSYSGHGRADMPPLSTTLGLSSVRSLPHLAVYPALT